MVLDLMATFCPVNFLPKGRKVIAGTIERPQQNIELTIEERRQRLKDILFSRKERLLEKYSPIRIFLTRHRGWRQSLSTLKFNAVIGEIALTHAAIEQDLKNELLYHWDVEIKLRLHGESLANQFLRQLEEKKIPDNFMSLYKDCIEVFLRLSKERNDTLKALYAYNQDTGNFVKINMQHFYSRWKSLDMPFEDFIALWHQKIQLKNLKVLKRELRGLRGRLGRLNAAVRIDKLQMFTSFSDRFGVVIPGWAVNNPYLYKEQLS